MKNKKKIIIAIIVIASIILITYLFMPIKVKGYLIYGNKICSQRNKEGVFASLGDAEHPGVAGASVTTYICKLCVKKKGHPNTATPDICENCAKHTGRCQQCGGLK